MNNPKSLAILAGAVLVGVVIGILLMAQYQAVKQSVVSTAPAAPAAPAGSAGGSQLPENQTSTMLTLESAVCGNRLFTGMMNNSEQWKPIGQKSCAGEVRASDGRFFEIKQGSDNQSVAELAFSLPAGLDPAKVVSVEGRIQGACRRQFEINTKTKYGEWALIGLLKCPPDHMVDVDYKFTPEIHDGKVGVLIVSGDNFNDLRMDEVSVKAAYMLASPQPE